MHWRRRKWLFIIPGKSMGNVARIQDGRFRGFAQAVIAVRQDVRQRAQHHAVVSQERFDAANGLRAIEIELVGCWLVLGTSTGPVATAPGSDNDARHRQKWFKLCSATARTRSGTASAVRGGDSFVQIKMNDVHTHVTRSSHSYQSVHVGAVHVN